MLTKTIESTKPKPVSSYSYQGGQQGKWKGGTFTSSMVRAHSLHISEPEFQRRNTIVKDLYSKCMVKTGNYYFPTTETKKQQYGKCLVKDIFADYYEFPLNETWPKDDHPYIVTVEAEKIEGLVLCTGDWLNSKPIVEEECRSES